MMLLIYVVYSKGHTERPWEKWFADGEVHSYYSYNQNWDKPQLTLEGVLMIIFYYSEFKNIL